ncbi:hypothetical protein GCK72_025679 [Caenorhabditis remanei]|uniref:INSulin related n=1 Tax=Caenorhabditis remanei TaxID=31234 RepID=A0A6A5G3D3_CAERE|nr:hypothetical protein GCK72_025679 [Caenorhabditis remanei]KAF1749212.1 hypothetical protein GCK72_025679 [Caenorhabditis remanei]
MKFFIFFVFILLAFTAEPVESRNCGIKAYKTIMRICPDGCTTDDATLPTRVCAFALSKEEIQNGCCPEE